MYALVALGFVMIYKASGVFNFAQGAMVYLAALSVVGCMEKGAPLWLAVILAFVIMTLFGIATEKFVLRKLVNQPPIALFMATIGLAFFIEGLAPMIFGSEPRALDLGIVDEPIPWVLDNWNMVISKFDLVASGVAAVLVAALALFFQYTRIGRALRAVADDHQAALSIGILGGFTSVPGAIIGGLIIGASEKLAEIYIPPVMQDLFGGNFGGIEGWFPYVLALLFLLVRPEGLFGEKHIDRV
jgi:branched-chain amino acid transport system permease protein